MSGEPRGRLGRGLAVLLGEGESGEAPVGPRAEVSVESIDENPYQPRRTFDEEELSSLGESIRNHGVLQPLLVRQVEGRYQLIAGERRLRAARAVGLPAVPVTVVDFNDQQVLEAALVENIQRADLNPIEKAQGFKDYLARYQMTQEQLAARLGLGRTTLTNLVALLDLPESIQAMVRAGQVSVGHAKVLKGLPDAETQLAVVREIVARGLSVHATQDYVKQLTASGTEEVAEAVEVAEGRAGRPAAEKTAHVQSVENELRQKLGLKVEVRVKSKDRGQIVLSFESTDDFERAVEALRR